MSPGARFTRGVDDPVPNGELALVSIQHAVLALAFLVYPLAAAQQIGLNAGQTANFLTACILSVGVATMLHCFRRPWGSGVLAVEVPTPVFLPAAVIAGGAGGLGGIAALSLISGVVGILFSRGLRMFKFLFPAEVCGVAVMMLGISLVRPGMVNALGIDTPEMGLDPTDVAVSTVTLVTIVAVAVFGRSRMKLLALALGLVAGLSMSYALGRIDTDEWHAMHGTPWLGWPDLQLTLPAFHAGLIPLAIVMGLVSNVDNVGMLVSIQRQGDPSWQRIDYRQASSGVSVSSAGDLVSAAFGGMPTGISSANVSLAHATGNISRWVALATGALLIAAAFTPRLVTALTLIPRPVIGAVMVYAAAYMLVSGMSLLLTRLLSERRIFVIGLSTVLGMTPALIPGVFSASPGLVRPVLESPLSVGTLCAMALVLLFRFGEAQRRVFSVPLPRTNNESLLEFSLNRALRQPLTELGERAGAAKALVDRAIDLTSEFVASVAITGVIGGELTIEVSIHDQRIELTLVCDAVSLTGAELDEFRSDHWERLKGSAVERIETIRHSTSGTRQKFFLAFE